MKASMEVKRSAPIKTPLEQVEIKTANFGYLFVNRVDRIKAKPAVRIAGSTTDIGNKSGWYFYAEDLRYIADCLREIADDLDANG